MKARFPLLFLLALSACASRPAEPQAHPHRATVVNDLFQVEQGMPVREVRKDQDFFFKKCEVNRSRPYFSRTEYECNDL